MDTSWFRLYCGEKMKRKTKKKQGWITWEDRFWNGVEKKLNTPWCVKHHELLFNIFLIVYSIALMTIGFYFGIKLGRMPVCLGGGC